MSIKLKVLRVQAGMTLESLAQACDLTRSYVSKVERGASTPSIGAALKLAKALKVPVEVLFGEPSDTDPVTITRTGDARAKRPAPGEPRVVAGTAPGHRMLAFVLQPGGERERDHPMSHHEGEEILYVLSGAVTLQLANRSEALQAGDCAHFNASVPHKITRRGEDQAKVLLVIAAAE